MRIADRLARRAPRRRLLSTQCSPDRGVSLRKHAVSSSQRQNLPVIVDDAERARSWKHVREAQHQVKGCRPSTEPAHASPRAGDLICSTSNCRRGRPRPCRCAREGGNAASAQSSSRRTTTRSQGRRVAAGRDCTSTATRRDSCRGRHPDRGGAARARPRRQQPRPRVWPTPTPPPTPPPPPPPAPPGRDSSRRTLEAAAWRAQERPPTRARANGGAAQPGDDDGAASTDPPWGPQAREGGALIDRTKLGVVAPTPQLPSGWKTRRSFSCATRRTASSTSRRSGSRGARSARSSPRSTARRIAAKPRAV